MNPVQQPNDPTNTTAPPYPDLPLCMNMPRLHASESDIQAHLFNMQEYYNQRQATLALHFEHSRKQLNHEYHKMQQHIQEMVEKQQAYQQRQECLYKQQQMESELASQQHLARLQNKSSEQQSAVASNEVKLKLRNLIISKNNLQSPPHWTSTQHRSLEQHSPPNSGLSPPPRANPPVLANLTDEYPLRKTVSEPNLKKMRPFTTSEPNLKMTRPRTYARSQATKITSPHSARRSHMLKNNPTAVFTSEPNIKVRLAIKQKMIERRSSPLLKRRDRHNLLKRNTHTLPVSVGPPAHSDPDSGPNTPPSATQPADGLPQDKDAPPFPLQMMSKMVTNQSLPNISLGQTREAMEVAGLEGAPGGMEAAMLSESELRARIAMANSSLLSAALPFYPIPPMLEGTPSDAYILAQMQAMEQAAQLSGESPAHYQQRVTGLTRTHSAPLPLPRQLLYQHSLWLQEQQELMRQSNPKHYLKKKIQSTILHRTGVKAKMENVDEETESRISQEMQEIREKDEEESMAMMQQLHEQALARAKHSQTKQALFQKMQRSRAASGDSRPSPYQVIPESLTRAKSYPAVRTSPPIPEDTSSTGLAYDSLMLKHQCVCGFNSNHEENPGRIESIYGRLQESGLVARCNRIATRKATLEELKSCHSEAYALLYGSDPIKLAESQINPKMFEHLLAKFCQLPCGGVGVDCDTTWNEGHTPTATRVAVGGVVDLALKVASGELENGFALVRPPGHHAEPTLAMGFCFFNNVAIAAKQLLANGVKKILIVDWDVHHGTGALDECGIERGLGFNVNVAWSSNLKPPMADAEYLAAFRSVVMPIAREFNPEVVLVSAGFDGATGHSSKLGGYEISSACFGHMTEELRTLAGGKLVLSLEGGYHLPAICDCSEICLRVLLGEKVLPVSQEEMLRPPCAAAVATLSKSIEIQRKHWPCLQRQGHTIGYSHAEALRTDDTHTTMRQLASLSVVKETDSEEKACEENENKSEDMDS